MTRGAPIGVMLVILLTSMTGCTAVTDGITGNSSSEEISVPNWELGDYWLYTFSTPDYSDDTTKLVVATTDIEEVCFVFTLSLIHI